MQISNSVLPGSVSLSLRAGSSRGTNEGEEARGKEPAHTALNFESVRPHLDAK